MGGGGGEKSCGGEYKNWVEGIEKGRRGEERGEKNKYGSRAFSLMRAKTVEVWDVIISVFIETNMGSGYILKSGIPFSIRSSQAIIHNF